MYTVIDYGNGALIEAVIVSRSAGRMRLAVAGMADALEIVRRGTKWLTDSGQELEFAFIADCAGAPKVRNLTAGASSGAM
jgi:hypothetical protein